MAHGGLEVTSLGGFQTSGPAIATADRAIKPVSVALAVFGALAALSLLIVAIQVVGRQLRRHTDETALLRALGAGPVMTMADAVTGIICAALVGCVLAVGVAIAISPLFPLGPVRPVYPVSVAADWTVLGLGFMALVLVVSGVAVLEAYLLDPHRRSRVAWVIRPASAGSRARGVVGTPGVSGDRRPFRHRPG